MTHKLTVFSAALAAAIGCAGSANAALLTSYNFDQTSGFVLDAAGTTPTGQETPAGPSPIGVNGFVDTLGGEPVYESLWWATKNPPITRGEDTPGGVTPIDTSDPNAPTVNDLGFAVSALKVIGFEGTGDIDDIIGDDWVEISTVYHRNNTIPVETDSLLSGIIRSNLALLLLPDGVPFSDLNDVNFTFDETFNQTSNGNPNPGACAGENPVGTACDDLFTFNIESFDSLSFMWDGLKYEVIFKLDEFVGSATDFPNCDVGTANPNDCTVWTGEEQVSRLSVFMEINQVPVPEPATLSLLGLGLLGMGLSLRRRATAA